MTRFRLRESRPGLDLERAFYGDRYPGGYRHDVWPDHIERVAASVEFLRRWQTRFRTAADLSCGDAAILRALAPALDTVFLGDLTGAPPVDSSEWGSRVVHTLPPGALPDSLAGLSEPVDLFVCSETLEHLDDPDGLLMRLTGRTRYLFVSTPVAEPAGSGNDEHYWSWDVADVGDLLMGCGWRPVGQRVVEPVSTRDMPGAYTYQFWLAVAR